MTAPEIVSTILKELHEKATIGVTTKFLDGYALKRITELGGKSVNKGYQPQGATNPFPATICTSVNCVVAHGLPSYKPLKNGDLLNIDMGVEKDGQCGDAAISFGIGEISTRDERLLHNARKALSAGQKAVRDHVLVRDVSRAIEQCALQNGYVTNKMLVGHGIGKEMHIDPPIPNFTVAYANETLQQRKIFDTFLTTGMKICLEPQITYKDGFGVQMDDGWTIKTVDQKNSAFFEAMIEVTDDGYKFLIDPFDL